MFELHKKRPQKTWVASGGNVTYLIVGHTGLAAKRDAHGATLPFSAIAIYDDGHDVLLGSYVNQEMAQAACKRKEVQNAR